MPETPWPDPATTPIHIVFPPHVVDALIPLGLAVAILVGLAMWMLAER